MSTNPNNAVGTNGAFGGRTSVNAFNDIMGAFQSRGVLSGWGISQSSGMTVSVGGNGTTRDVAVAEDASGNKTSVNNISGAPILVTLDSAPASNSRYDAIVAYVDKPPVSSATQDNPECCGIIPVTGTAASTPSYPDDAAIRSAITADGASGATAYYAVIAYVLVASGTTSITSGMITGAGNPVINATLGPNSVGTPQIQTRAVTSDKIDWTTIDVIDLSSYVGTIVTEVTRANLYKFGRICILNMTCRLSAYTANNFAYVLRGLPSNLRPSENFEVFTFCSTTYTAMRGLVNTAGELAIIGGTSIASGSYYNISGTYITPA